MTHGVTDDQRGSAAGQRDDVVPVTADHVGTNRLVPMRDFEPGRDPRPAREQAALQRTRGAPLAVVKPGILDTDRGPGGKLCGERLVTGAESRGASGTPERRAPHHGPAGRERNRQERGLAGGDLLTAGMAAD